MRHYLTKESQSVDHACSSATSDVFPGVE